MAKHVFNGMHPKYGADSDTDWGTPRGIKHAVMQAYIKARGYDSTIKVTDFKKNNEVVLDGEFHTNPRDPQSTIRTSLGPIGYGHTAVIYQGNPLTSSVREAYRWFKSLVLPGYDYISPSQELADVGSPSWNREIVQTYMNMGVEQQETLTKTQDGEKVVKTRPMIKDIRGNDVPIRKPISCEIVNDRKRKYYGPGEKIKIKLTDEEGGLAKNIVDIDKRYFLKFSPLGELIGGSDLKGLEKVLKYFYGLPIVPFGLNSGVTATVGDGDDEHTLYDSHSDYLRLGQVLNRPKTHVGVYDDTFHFDVVPDFTFWSTLQKPNPKYWYDYLLKKKWMGEETGFREKRHALNYFSTLKEVDLRGENGRGAKLRVNDELIYSDVLYDFALYGPEFDKLLFDFDNLLTDQNMQRRINKRIGLSDLHYYEGESGNINIERQNRDSDNNVVSSELVGALKVRNGDCYFEPLSNGRLSTYLKKLVKDSVFLGKCDNGRSVYTNEQDVGHIVLKRSFDHSDALSVEPEVTKFMNPFNGKVQEKTKDVTYVDPDLVECEYNINAFLDNDFKYNGIEIMNMILSLCGELQPKLRFGSENLKRYDPYHLPTNLDDGLDMMVTARDLNGFENWITKSIDQDLTPKKVRDAIRDIFGIEPPNNMIKQIDWDSNLGSMDGQYRLADFMSPETTSPDVATCE